MSGVGGDSYYPSIAQAVEGGDELVVEAPGSEGSAHSSASDADVVMTVVRQHGVKDKQRLNSDGRSGGGTALEQVRAESGSGNVKTLPPTLGSPFCWRALLLSIHLWGMLVERMPFPGRPFAWLVTTWHHTVPSGRQTVPGYCQPA